MRSFWGKNPDRAFIQTDLKIFIHFLGSKSSLISKEIFWPFLHISVP
jgi:hypothetical protein